MLRNVKRIVALSSLTLSILLASCDGGSSTPTSVPNRTVALGTAQTQVIRQDFGGDWSVNAAALPAWLSVSTSSGKGNVVLTVKANRNAATPLSADQPTLSGIIRVSWISPDRSSSGTATWTVTADQFTLTGRVADTAQVSAADIGTPVATRRSDDQAAVAQSVIVTYRSAAVRDAVLRGSGQSVQSVGAQAIGTQALATLRTLGVGADQRDSLNSRSVVLRIPATAPTLAALRADSDTVAVTPSVQVHALDLDTQSLSLPVTPTDQYAGLQWAYPLLGYGAVWKDMQGGGYTRPVTVAVVDTGVRFEHPDLAGKLYQPGDGAMDVVADLKNGDGDGADTDPTDPSVKGRTEGSHGTHVTGIIVANWGNFAAPCSGCSTTGVVGATYLAPVKVLPVRALDAQGNGETADIANGIRYAAGLPVTIGGTTYTNPHPAQVINLSLGGPTSATEAQPMCDAVAEATAQGALVVAAAGNDGDTNPFYPAACPGAVSVASVSLSGASAPLHADYSNAYAQVQLSAPGGAGRIPTYFNGGTLNGAPFGDYIISTGWDYVKNQPSYEIESGTSQAAPQVSALAALLLSKGVTSTAGATLNRMIATATDLGAAGRDNLFGYGLINAAAALGAPAVSDSFGLRLQDDQGRPFQPALDSLGRFKAYLGDGTYQVVGGRDRNGNGIVGETGEPQDTRNVTLGSAAPTVDLGDLIPR